MFFRKIVLFAAALAATGLIACGGDDPEVRREISLEASPTWPSGSALLAANQLTVGVSGLEPLEDGAHYGVWMETDQGHQRLGELADGELVVSVDPAEASDASLVVVEEGEAPPDSPGELVRMSGTVGADMAFAPDYVESVHESSGQVLLEDASIDVDVAGLPAPPAGMHYEVWGTCHHHEHVEEGHHDEGFEEDHHDVDHDDHDDGETEEHHHGMLGPADSGDHDDEHADEEHHHGEDFFGHLEDDGHLHENHHASVGDCESVVITLESDRGTDDASPVIVMHGDLELPDIEHEAGGHMH